jgi:hypothetical protein
VLLEGVDKSNFTSVADPEDFRPHLDETSDNTGSGSCFIHKNVVPTFCNKKFLQKGLIYKVNEKLTCVYFSVFIIVFYS